MAMSMKKLASRKLYSSSRLFATAATKGKSDLRSGQSSNKALFRQTKLANGLTIVAIENNSPIERVGIFVRAGPRFELPGQLGASHALRTAAGLSTKKTTGFAITRNLDYVGGTFTSSSTREDTNYVVDTRKGLIDGAVSYLAETVTSHAFKPWEVNDLVPGRMKVDRSRMKEAPDVRLIELLHAAAFRGGLSHSLFSPGYMVGKHDHSLLTEYVNNNYVTSRMAVVGSGVELEQLVDAVERSFTFNSNPPPQVPSSKFVSNSIRKTTAHPAAYVAVAAEGVSAKNAKEVVALALFQTALGGNARVKYSDSRASVLGSAAASGTSHPFVINTLNVSYSDSGLFGFAVGVAPDDAEKVVKAVVKKMREMGKGLTESQLNNAKNALKSDTLQSFEVSSTLLEEIGTQVLNGSTILTPDTVASAIDAVSLNDVNSVASKVVKGKVAIAALGQVHAVPYLEDLL